LNIVAQGQVFESKLAVAVNEERDKPKQAEHELTIEP
jgi:hypothetical protein